MTPTEALRAITARINGEWDCPALVQAGPLSTNVLADVERIARSARPSAPRTPLREALSAYHADLWPADTGELFAMIESDAAEYEGNEADELASPERRALAQAALDAIEHAERSDAALAEAMHVAAVAVNNATATARELRGALLAVLNRSCSNAARGDALARAQKACAAAAWVDDFNAEGLAP